MEDKVLFYEPLESEVAIIQQLYYSKNKSIKLAVNLLRAPAMVGEIEIEISKTTLEYIYLLKYKEEGFSREKYVIPVEAIPNFDLLVNHCPQRKVRAYRGLYK